MPVTRIAIREGKNADYKQALMDEFRVRAFLGIERSDDLVQIQVFWAPGKTAAQKLAMYKKIVERLGTNRGVRPEDILISVNETAAENWSFGNGETQFYEPAT